MEIFERVVRSAAGSNSKPVSVNPAIFFTRQIIGLGLRQFIQYPGKKLGFGWRVELMPDEEIFSEMQISHRRNDGRQKDSDSLFSLRQQLLERL